MNAHITWVGSHLSKANSGCWYNWKSTRTPLRYLFCRFKKKSLIISVVPCNCTALFAGLCIRLIIRPVQWNHLSASGVIHFLFETPGVTDWESVKWNAAFQIHYERPRNYLFTYAVDDDNSNELYAEYHLGRSAFRGCKKGTKFCAWHKSFPNFYQWRHICKDIIVKYIFYKVYGGLAYDVYKDTFKIYADGEKVESGSWSENPNVIKMNEKVQFKIDISIQLVRPNGLLVIGQDQDNVGGGFDRSVFILRNCLPRCFIIIQKTILLWLREPDERLECFTGGFSYREPGRMSVWCMGQCCGLEGGAVLAGRGV